jgi:2-hydroxychromene-2-carboxylate isomerase
MQTIRFYFDYISSNAYLAWTQLPALSKAHCASIEAVPVLFAGLLEAHGQLGPAEIPAKSLWMVKNTLRKAAVLGVPLNPPAFHPFNPLLALRISSLPLPAPQLFSLIDALFRAVWVDRLHASDPDVVARVADERGLAGATLVAAAQSSDCKAKLRAQTDAAIARGVFGVPSMELGHELFWGYDDFPYLERFLEGKDSLDSAEWQKWHGPARPSAVRRRFRSEQRR